MSSDMSASLDNAYGREAHAHAHPSPSGHHSDTVGTDSPRYNVRYPDLRLLAGGLGKSYISTRGGRGQSWAL